MGLFALGINFANLQRGGTVPPTANGNAGLQIPQINPAVAKAPAPLMPFGSGNSNFQGFNPETSFSSIGSKQLTPNLSDRKLNAHLGVGANLNYTC
jgi:hypothetical protein